MSDSNGTMTTTDAPPAVPPAIRAIIDDALARRRLREAEESAERERRAAEGWARLLDTLRAALPAALWEYLPLSRPEDWIGVERRYCLRLEIPGLCPVESGWAWDEDCKAWKHLALWRVVLTDDPRKEKAYGLATVEDALAEACLRYPEYLEHDPEAVPF